jgi:hypothetical protein
MVFALKNGSIGWKLRMSFIFSYGAQLFKTMSDIGSLPPM